MTEKEIQELKRLAEELVNAFKRNNPLSEDDREKLLDYEAAANPQAVLALIQRIEDT